MMTKRDLRLSGAGGLLAALALASAPVAALAQAVQPVSDSVRAAQIVAQLQRGLDRLGSGGKLGPCGPVLGLQLDDGGYDPVFGAACRLTLGERTQSAVLCDDERNGRFSLTLAPIPDVQTMGRFIAVACGPAAPNP